MDALTQIAEQLGFDQTFFYLFGMMFALYLLLSAVYLKPFQKLLQHRKARTEGAKKEAEQLSAQAEEKFNQYKLRLKDVNEKARHVYHECEEQAKKEESRLIGDASNKSKAILQDAQKQLDSQRKSTLDAIASDIGGIANDIATKVLGRPVGTR